jgi:hypothetical protein
MAVHRQEASVVGAASDVLPLAGFLVTNNIAVMVVLFPVMGVALIGKGFAALRPRPARRCTPLEREECSI